MNSQMLKYFVDPIFETELTLTDNNELQEECGSKYPIIRGIPRFVSLEYYKDEVNLDNDKVQTTRSFGDKWRLKATNEMGLGKGHVDKLFNMVGVYNEDEFKSLFKDGMNCLNAGCGVSWPEYFFNVNEKVNRFSVDISLAVETAYQRTKMFDNVCVSQADIFNLPFRKEFFDIIFSEGVLHHTGNAEQAFTSLCYHLKPGGLIGIYIYCNKPFLRKLADEKIRECTTKMSFDECYEFSEQVMELGKELQKVKDIITITKDIPLLGIKKGTYKLQQFIFDYFVKCFYRKDLTDAFSIMANLDWYHPSSVTFHTKEELQEWFL